MRLLSLSKPQLADSIEHPDINQLVTSCNQMVINITKWLQDRTNWLYGVKPKCQFLKLSISSKFKDVLGCYNLKEFFQQVDQKYQFQDILIYYKESITIQLHDATNWLHSVTIWLQAWLKCQFLKLLLSSKFEDVIGSQNLDNFFQQVVQKYQFLDITTRV